MLNKPEIMELATTISAALFTSGDGKHADRLILQLHSGEEWGGWSQEAAKMHIAKIIEVHLLLSNRT